MPTTCCVLCKLCGSLKTQIAFDANSHREGDDEVKLARGRTFSGDYLNGVLSVVGSGLASQARRIVINNQNPFKIAHAIWLRPDQTWRGPTEQEQQEDMHEVDALMRRHRQHQRLVKCVGSGWQVGRAGEEKGSRIMLSFAHWQFVHLPSPLVVAAVHVLPASVSVCVCVCVSLIW